MSFIDREGGQLLIFSDKRKLGKSQVEVTQLGFGGAPIGDLYAKLPEEEALSTLIEPNIRCQSAPLTRSQRYRQGDHDGNTVYDFSQTTE